MPRGHGREARADDRLDVSRGGLATVLFAIARGTEAGKAAFDGKALRLTRPLGSSTIPVGEIDGVAVDRVWGRSSVRVRTGSRESLVSGLSRGDARVLAAALRDAVGRQFRQTLAAHSGTLASIDARLGMLSRPPDYLGRRAFGALLRDVQDAAAGLPRRWPDWIPPRPETETLARIRALLDEPEATRRRANEAFLADELQRSELFLDRVEARPLTDEQRLAVCVDDDRNLVVAAAGSGKTSVMVAKVGWVVERGDRRPDEVLLLAFARNAARELGGRVGKRLDGTAARDIAVQTFHSLGLSIIGAAEGKRPSVAAFAADDKALLDVLKGIIGDLLGHREHGRALIRWLAYGTAPYRSTHEFALETEYWDYIRTQEIRSLQGELVKSYEECAIANFLYLNGVPYAYECAYEHDTATATKGQYKPDFHLTDAGIYIEHFALSASGKTPPFIDQEEYLASRDWKLELHEAHGTTLVETFSHEAAAGLLQENLAEKLRAHSVALKPIARRKIFEVLNEQDRVAPFTQLVATFLNHFKGSRLSVEDMSRRAAGRRDAGRAEAFLRAFGPIRERYEGRLRDAGEIDFHDMINRATDHVAAGRYRSPYRYLLVDEFQDISPRRAALLKALLDQSPDAQLFAVGDDWQAIYRFAGSDVAVMREFEAHFGDGERSRLETTFRCSDGVSELATRFILANPEQIEKSVRARRRVDGPGIWIGFGGDAGTSLLEEALDRIGADAGSADQTASVLVLGRYNHLKPDMGRLAGRYRGWTCPTARCTPPRDSKRTT